MEASYYPAFLNIKEKQCVVVGGGKVAERKVLSLLKSGAKIKIISPNLTNRLQREKNKGNIYHINRNYKKGDLKDAFLVIAATSDDRINKEIALEVSCLTNVVDYPDMANFIVPSVIKRGLLTIAVSTSGVSPALSKAIRKELEKLYTEEFSKYLNFLKKLRKRIISDITDKKLRQQIFKEIASEKMLYILRQKGYKVAKDLVLERISKVKS